MADTLWEPHAQTPRLYLRPMTNGDVVDVFEVRRHPDVYKYLATTAEPPSLENTREWLAVRSWPGKFNFAILLVDANRPREDWKLIGAVGCARGTPELGYMINADDAGKGYATEAVNALLGLYWKYVPSARGEKDFAEWSNVASPKPLLGVHDHLEARTAAQNSGSRRVLEKVGFRFLGISSKGEYNPGGADELAMYRLERPKSAEAS